MTTRVPGSIGVLTAVLAIGIAAGVSQASPATFAEAEALAAKEKKPLLVDFYAVWCGPCKRFAKDVDSDAEIQKSLEQVVLFKTDAEKGEGLELAKKHEVHGYPTFVLLNGSGETVERWAGYSKPHFTTTLASAVQDPTTIETKRARFEKSPSAKDAEKLSRYYGTRGEHAQSVRYARSAAELDPAPQRRLEVVNAVADGVRDKELPVSDLEKERDALLATKTEDPGVLLGLTGTLSAAGRDAEKPEIVVPALEPALAATAGSTDPEVVQQRTSLLIDRALLVEKDKAKAYQLMLASMPEGWKNDANRLNSMAWWCFENQTNLKEAEEMARSGVALAPAGPDRAMVSDTLAEILFVQGKKAEAITAIESAIQDDPNKKYYKEQLERFRGQSSGTH